MKIVKSEGAILSDVLDNTRQLTRWYISNLKGQDMYRRFQVNGQTLNSPYWICGHITWAENFLVLQQTGYENFLNHQWLNTFGISSTHPVENDNLPDLREILNTMKAIHENAMSYLPTLVASQLDEPNVSGITFGGQASKRNIIHHAIRHEGIHAGQLALLCKMYGVKTV